MKKLKHTKGYILIHYPEHPRAHNGYVLEHIVVAEQKVGRPLLVQEQVHHLNSVKSDNRPENLVVLSAKEHSHIHKGHRKVVECLQCHKSTTNKFFCSNTCRALHKKGEYTWLSDAELIALSKTMSTREIAKKLGGVSHVSVWKRLKSIPGSPKGRAHGC